MITPLFIGGLGTLDEADKADRSNRHECADIRGERHRQGAYCPSLVQ